MTKDQSKKLLIACDYLIKAVDVQHEVLTEFAELQNKLYARCGLSGELLKPPILPATVWEARYLLKEINSTT